MPLKQAQELAVTTAINGTVLAFVSFLTIEWFLKIALLVLTIAYTYLKIRHEVALLRGLEAKIHKKVKGEDK